MSRLKKLIQEHCNGVVTGSLEAVDYLTVFFPMSYNGTTYNLMDPEDSVAYAAAGGS